MTSFVLPFLGALTNTHNLFVTMCWYVPSAPITQLENIQFSGFLRIASKHVYSTHLRSVFSKEVTDNNTNINQMKITLWFFTCGLHPTDQEAVPAHQLDEQPSPHRWWYIPAWHLCVMFLVFTWHWHRSDRYHHRHDLIATPKACQHTSFLFWYTSFYLSAV